MNNNLFLRALILPIFIFQFTFLWAQDAVPTSIHFIENDYLAAKKQATKTEKLILVKFSAKWCMPCKVMDEYVWTDPCLISSIKQNCYAVAADYDHIDVYELKQEFGVKTVPIVLLLDACGEELMRFTGSCTASEIESQIDEHKLVEPKVEHKEVVVVLVEDKIEPIKPTVKPTEVVVVPVEPKIEPTKPVIKPTEVVVVPVEDKIEPIKPTVKPTEVVVVPVEDKIEPAKPAVKPTEVVVVPVEPKIEPIKSTVKPTEVVAILLKSPPERPNPPTSPENPPKPVMNAYKVSQPCFRPVTFTKVPLFDKSSLALELPTH